MSQHGTGGFMIVNGVQIPVLSCKFRSEQFSRPVAPLVVPLDVLTLVDYTLAPSERQRPEQAAAAMMRLPSGLLLPERPQIWQPPRRPLIWTFAEQLEADLAVYGLPVVKAALARRRWRGAVEDLYRRRPWQRLADTMQPRRN